MKKFLALFLLFGIVGCKSHTAFTGIFTAEVSHDIEVVAMKYPESYSYEDIKNQKYKYFEYEILQSKVVENINDITTGEIRRYAEAINLKTGKKFHIGNIPSGFQGKKYKYSATELAKLNCELLYQSECVISIDGDPYKGGHKVIYEDLGDFSDKKLAKIEKEKEQQLVYERMQEAEKRMLETKKQDAFNKLYSTCIGYGFEEQNAIASCIQQEIFNEKKLAILKEQQLAQLEYTNNQQRNQQIQEQEETSFWLKVLEGVAENLADPNTWENARQNAEIEALKRQRLLESINN